MGGEVEMVSLSSLVDPDRGITYGIVQPGKHTSDGTPIVRVTDIRNGRISVESPLRVDPKVAEKFRRTTLRGGELLLTLVGTVGELAIVPPQLAGWNTARAVAVIPVLDDPGPLWIKYALQAGPARHYIDSRLNTTVQATLNLRDVSSFPIPMPKTTERKAITHILGSLDDKIELNRQMNHTLEQMAQTLFKSWFINFDPVVYNAVQAGQPVPDRLQTTAERYRQKPEIQTLPQHILDLFPNRFEGSELEEIPEGWQVKPLASLIELIGGGTPKTNVERYWNGDIPWFSVTDAPSEADLWVIRTEKYITPEGLNNSSAKVLPVGSTVISARGTVGKCALLGTDMAFNQSCYGIMPTEGYSEYFINHLIRTKISMLQQSGHGSVFNTITRSTFDHIKVVDCGGELTKHFHEMIQPYLDRMLANIHESEVVAEIRNQLIPSLISGDLRVTGVSPELGARR